MDTLDIDLDTQHAIKIVQVFAAKLPSPFLSRWHEIEFVVSEIVDIDYRALPSSYAIPANTPSFVTDLRDVADSIIQYVDWKAVFVSYRETAILNEIEGLGNVPGNPDLSEIKRQQIADRMDWHVNKALSDIRQLVHALNDVIENDVAVGLSNAPVLTTFHIDTVVRLPGGSTERKVEIEYATPGISTQRLVAIYGDYREHCISARSRYGTDHYFRSEILMSVRCGREHQECVVTDDLAALVATVEAIQSNPELSAADRRRLIPVINDFNDFTDWCARNVGRDKCEESRSVVTTVIETSPRKPRPFGRKALIQVSHPHDNHHYIYFRIIRPTDIFTYGDVREIVRKVDKRLETIPEIYRDQLLCEFVVGYTGYHVTYDALSGLRKLAAEDNLDRMPITPMWLGFFFDDESIKNPDHVFQGILRQVA